MIDAEEATDGRHATEAAGRGGRRRMLTLLLDITTVNVVPPSIVSDLGASFTDLQSKIDT